MPRHAPPARPSFRPPPRSVALVPLLCTLGVSGGCTTVPSLDLKRMTYETLRREDCRLNQLDQFCQRNFANEYAEYERLRRHFIRDAAEASEPLPAIGDSR